MSCGEISRASGILRMSLRAVADPPSAHIRGLYTGELVAVADWRCPGHDLARRPAVELGDGYDIVVTRRGTYARECGGVRAIADAGAALFWHPGEEYRITHPVPGGDECSVFRLPESGLRDLLRTWDPVSAESPTARFPAARVPLGGPTYLLHRLAIRRLDEPGALRALEGEECAVRFVRGAVRQLYSSGRVRRTVRPERSNRSAAEYVARVREVIARRPHERLTLAAIAREVGCSPFHLSRVVSEREGVGVYGMVLQLRLRTALELVLDGREPVGWIGLEAGFASHSHFDDAFRREFGCTPTAARRLPARACRRVLAAPAPTRGGSP